MNANDGRALESKPLSELSLVHQGKVRDTYTIDDDLLLSVATDRTSVYDIVLGSEIYGKGRFLTSLTVFWIEYLVRELNIAHHLVAFGGAIDQYLPKALRDWPELQTRALVIKKLRMVPYEFVVRGNLTGSSWDEYKKSGTLFGEALPVGMANGDVLTMPKLTPTTKATNGHDEPVPLTQVLLEHQRACELSLQAFGSARVFARLHGVLLADTKFEFGYDRQGNVVLADEVLTADSSRYWSYGAWKETRGTGKLPPSFDKQVVRDWAATAGVRDLDPKREADRGKGKSIMIPTDVIEKTLKAYQTIFTALARETFEEFWSSRGVRLL